MKSHHSNSSDMDSQHIDVTSYELDALNINTSLQEEELEQSDFFNLRYGFRIGKIGLLLKQQQYSEVLNNPDIYPLPLTHDWFKGFINSHGSIIPVYDFSISIGIENGNATDKNYVLVIGTQSDAVGILLHKLPQALKSLQKIKISEFEPPKSLKPFLICSYRVLDQDWFEFDYTAYIRSLINTPRQLQ